MVLNKAHVEPEAQPKQRKLGPDDLRPEKVVIKTERNVTLFYRQDAFLSNFYPSVFELEGRSYNCNEQYYCSQKAKYFGDKAKESQIMASSNPAEMKYICQTRLKGSTKTSGHANRMKSCQ